MRRNCNNTTTTAPASSTIWVQYNTNTNTNTNSVDFGIDTKSTHDSTNKKLYGWICPLCGRGVSPYNNYCDCSYLTINERINTNPIITEHLFDKKLKI